MKTRLIASAAVAAVVVLGTSGCAMLAPQGTTIQYSPADGMNVPDASGPVVVRNALIVANEDGSEGNLVAALINESDEAQVLHLEVGEQGIALSVRVPAGDTLSLGTEETAPLPISGLDTPAGATVPIFFQSGDGDGVITDIPVLDGTLDYLAPLVP